MDGKRRIDVQQLNAESTDALETLIGKRQKNAGEGSVSAIMYEGSDGGGGDDDDDDIWEDEVQVGDDALLGAMPSLGMGSDISLSIDASLVPGSAAAAGSPTAALAPEPTRQELEAQRRHKRLLAEQRRRSAEVVHRVHLQCWLGHSSMLSAQADEPALQAALLSLAPPELVPSVGAAEPDALARLSCWLHAYLRDLPASAAGRGAARGQAGGGRGAARGRGRGRGGAAAGAAAAEPTQSAAAEAEEEAVCERAWLMVRLVQLAQGAHAPEWAVAAAPRAASRLLGAALPPPGVLPWYAPPPPRGEATTAGLEKLVAGPLAAGVAWLFDLAAADAVAG